MPLVIFCVSLALLAVAQAGSSADEISQDAAHYMSLARSLLRGEGFTDRTAHALNIPRPSFPFPDTYRAPLYPILIAMVSLLTGDHFAAGKWICVMTGATIPPLVYLFARHRLEQSPAAGLLAVAIVLVNHHQVLSATRVLTETPYTAAVLATASVRSRPAPTPRTMVQNSAMGTTLRRRCTRPPR